MPWFAPAPAVSVFILSLSLSQISSIKLWTLDFISISHHHTPPLLSHITQHHSSAAQAMIPQHQIYWLLRMKTFGTHCDCPLWIGVGPHQPPSLLWLPLGTELPAWAATITSFFFHWEWRRWALIWFYHSRESQGWAIILHIAIDENGCLWWRPRNDSHTSRE